MMNGSPTWDYVASGYTFIPGSTKACDQVVYSFSLFCFLLRGKVSLTASTMEASRWHKTSTDEP